MLKNASTRFAVALRGSGQLADVRERLVSLAQAISAHADALAAAILAGGAVLRLVLGILGWPATDSDEGTMGLIALHIAFRGEHPIFFYGSQYLGPLEAYAAAPLFRVFGPTLIALRVTVILISTLALGCIYLLTRRLFGRGLALFTLALLAVGSSEAMAPQIFARGGYAEVLLFGALTLLLAVELARPADGDDGARRRLQRLLASGSWRRLGVYAALGVAIGLGVWVDTLVLPFVLGALALVALFRWRELRTRAGLCLALGLLLGLAPLLAYAVTAPDHNPFAGVLAVHQSDNAYQHGVLPLLAGEVVGTVLVSVPNMTGGAALFPLSQQDAWPLAARGGPAALLASLAHGLWGLAYLALLVAAVIVGWRVVWPAWVQGMKARGEGRRFDALEGARRDALVRECGRLALLGGAGLTVLLFAASPVAARAPENVSRYLIGVMIALPAVLAPLWWLAWAGGPSRRRLVARAGLFLVVLAYGFGFIEQARAVPAAHAVLTQQSALIGDLERLGATRIYSEYWTCGRLIFLSQERILCAALDGQLRPDLDRYMPYRAAVAAVPVPFYVFPLGSAQAASFAARAAATPGAYTRWLMDGYVIYHASAH